VISPLREIYLTTHNTHKRQTSIPQAGFEPAIPASERLQTKSLEGVGTGIGKTLNTSINFTIYILIVNRQNYSGLNIVLQSAYGTTAEIIHTHLTAVTEATSG
jgi:hypothetical protein